MADAPQQSDAHDNAAGSPPPQPPSWAGMAASFATSMGKFAASGFKRVEPDAHQARIDECQSCRHRTDTRCTLCGCFIDKKAWLPHEDCPLGHWPV